MAENTGNPIAERYGLLLDAIPLPVFLTDSEGKVLRINSHMAEFLELTQAKVHGRALHEFVVDDQQQRLTEMISSVTAGGRKIKSELDVVASNGLIFSVNVELGYLADDSVCILSVISCQRQLSDIAWLKRYYLTHKGINDSIQSPVFSVDTQYRYVAFNKAHADVMKAIYGTQVETGISLFDCITYDKHREQAKRNIDRALKGEFLEEELQTSEDLKKRHYYEVSYSPVRDENDEIIGVAVLEKDLTRRKNTEAELRGKLEQNLSLFEEMMEGFALHEVILDENGNPVDYRFLEMNPAFERLTGINRNTAIGKTVLELMPDTEKEWIQKYGEVALTGKPLSFESYSGALNRHYQVVAYSTRHGMFAVLFNDITERVQSERLLRLSEEKFNKAFQNSPYAIFITNADSGKVVEVNETIYRLAGFTSEDLIGKTTLELNIWESLELRNRFLEMLAEKGRVTNFEAGFRKKDGKVLTGLISAEFIDIQGERFLLSVILDISDRKTMEHSLRASEEKWKMLVNTIPDQIVLFDAQNRLTFINHLPEGKLMNELIGQTIASVYNPEIEKIFEAASRKAGMSGSVECQEYAVQRTDEDNQYYESYFVPVIQGDKQTSTMVISHNITHRKLSDKALKDSEEQHRLLLETAMEGIIVTQGVRFSYFNPRMTELTGYSPEELAEIEFVNLIHPDDRELVLRNYGRRIRGEVTEKSYVFRLLRKDGQCRWVEITGIRIQWKGEPASLSFINDIHDHKLALEALRGSEARLKELNATKDKFFSIIAHDLKSPFNNIVVLSNLLVEQVQSNDKENIEEYAGLISSSTQQAMSLLVNLLDWSRSQTGRLVCTPEYIDLVSVVNETEALLSESLRQKSIVLKKELPRTLLAHADKVMISTVLRNLVSNAIKFTRPNGQIIISSRKTETELSISVIDNGVGMNEETLGKLFRIEESISTKGTDNERGTGLGLILCREFIEKHNGSIRAESEPGMGSVFTFTIPGFKMH
ncbi:MAG: PAS domain S-box protein [Bacteroidales bacterium]|nr:PAS domain S-box protein [Bacteroidales bacterium]